MASICCFWMRPDARSWTVLMSCDSHDLLLRKPCCWSAKRLLSSGLLRGCCHRGTS
ncbi:hypothetical protein DPMN_087284 [Dreissena polymorpha]|uniref:Uncharacterized protein n=1 Tax=Dreissena polymorpha TaxID=45954 RepID=A0A9D4KS49_DREPO|nr:hypothetical protein DPMN_087284 [Dreissena polymorpha]